ncbi:MAG: anaerobic ribonucleoside-triphosphate reductase activating protein [Desulfovermiculus sp.]
MSGAPKFPMEKDNPWSSVRGLQPGSLCDWPGHVSAVLFLGGCNLRCPTCHNAGLAWTPEIYPPLSRENIQKFIQSRRTWLDGLVISGGEPTTVPGISELLTEISSFGLPLKLDTNGLLPNVIHSLFTQGLIQAVAVDVKGPWSKYPLLTGGCCSQQQAKNALEDIFALAQEYPETVFFRCTAVPDLTSEDLQQVQEYLPSGSSLSIQAYIPTDNTQLSTKSPALTSEKNSF